MLLEQASAHILLDDNRNGKGEITRLGRVLSRGLSVVYFMTVPEPLANVGLRGVRFHG